MTLNKLTDAVKCRQTDLKRVLFELRRDGVVSETDGPRNSKIYKLEN